jgi:AraC family transcriptional regulator
MDYIYALDKALTYIETHLEEEIKLADVANEAGYSLYHFQRVFKGVVGDSLKEYIRKRRITEAAKELTNTNKSIIDIAIKYGYQSREGFSRAFERVFGRNPSQVKQNGLLYFIREQMTFDYMMFEYQKRKKGIQPLFRKLPERIIVGKKCEVIDDGSNLQEIPLLWHEWNMNREWEEIKERKYDDECMGICMPSDSDRFEYLIGHEVNKEYEIPEGMVSCTIPPTFYAVFTVIGPITESVQKTWDYIYTIWLQESDYECADTYDIEYYYYKQGELVADLFLPIISSLNKEKD